MLKIKERRNAREKIITEKREKELMCKQPDYIRKSIITQEVHLLNENNFMRVNDVAQELGISISHAYKIMRQLNKELKAQGYMTIAGRVNRKYFTEKFCYGRTERK